jgi:peptidoglycan/xylan/chitin deacetylase (PgdA/CDA1 family)
LIGVIANDNEKGIVREFFELFKTPWEFYKETSDYDVVISSVDAPTEVNTRLLVLYSSEKIRFDYESELETGLQTSGTILEYRNKHFPIYGKLQTYHSSGDPLIKVIINSSAAAIEVMFDNKKIVRIGFNIFQEILYLLSSGQPTEFAHVPTIEIHISILRDLILNAGNPLIEIPPVPAGYNFTVCLTHDIDFYQISNHRFDHTMFGFLYRALIGSLINMLNGKVSLKKLLTNWKAACSVPCVYCGLTKDFWNQFDRYVEVEKDIQSTFFVIPFKNNRGRALNGRAPKRRATRYDIVGVKQEIRKLLSNGNEIALHGIDAWHDIESGRKEMDRISQATGKSNIGVRMHWLYFDPRSHEVLDNAGFSYDSSIGYNDTIGYKAGSMQVFRPPGARFLLELPMHIQDTALFYPGRLNLNEDEAYKLIEILLKDAIEFGGVLTINWHDRSMAPERLWGDFYVSFLQQLKALNAWFGTAEQVVQWFNKRRSVSFEEVQLKDGKLYLKLKSNQDNVGPDLMVRIHKPITQTTIEPSINIQFSDGLDAQINLN